MSLIPYCEASADVLGPLYNMLISSQRLGSSPQDTKQLTFDIEYVQKSESGWLLFVQTANSRPEEKRVLKLLSDYQDARYNLGSIRERQHCQLEAFRWNNLFSPSVYYGLARMRDLHVQQKKIVFDQILTQPSKEDLDPSADYALVMRQLPQEGRLDALLEMKDEDSLQLYMQSLIERVVEIHTHAEPLSVAEGNCWGSIDQLQEKLRHNLALADPVLADEGNTQQVYPEEFRTKFQSLKNTMQQHFVWDLYEDYFKSRIRDQQIKRCHGDLKSPNLWIISENTPRKENVFILDAIDFNPMYSNIDTLSDFATLIVDVQTRGGSSELVESMRRQYLQQTGQDDEASKALLNYYLFEKAYIGAAISIVYDGLPDLGQSYLEVAQIHLQTLLAPMLTPA